MCGTEAHWCRHKLQAGCSRSRSGSPLNSFRPWHPSSHLPADRLRKAHSMSRSIAGYGPPGSGLHGRVVTVQAANHFEGHLENPRSPAVSGSVRRSILRLLLAPGTFGLSRPVGLSASAPHT
ncbi:hypothetical protein H0G86_011121 [Trichoderma simmonsii]|uniref:Uncharacterized protein n=1 Tax=Trichoderma simmonsii TaxID=1491479 RepID=A0A8G0LQ58_9HYPO|nr:hypothetical protein H0G86_011121 [Trichoderma simmonsii]